jgi:hypothetical protein
MFTAAVTMQKKYRMLFMSFLSKIAWRRYYNFKRTMPQRVHSASGIIEDVLSLMFIIHDRAIRMPTAMSVFQPNSEVFREGICKECILSACAGASMDCLL